MGSTHDATLLRLCSTLYSDFANSWPPGDTTIILKQVEGVSESGSLQGLIASLLRSTCLINVCAQKWTLSQAGASAAFITDESSHSLTKPVSRWLLYHQAARSWQNLITKCCTDSVTQKSSIMSAAHATSEGDSTIDSLSLCPLHSLATCFKYQVRRFLRMTNHQKFGSYLNYATVP